MQTTVRGFLRIVNPTDPLEARRRVYLVDATNKIITELAPDQELVMTIDIPEEKPPEKKDKADKPGEASHG